VGTLRLTLLRHAHAEPLIEGTEDFARELSPRGRAEASAQGQQLARALLVPDLILASSAQRTRSTVQLLAAVASVPRGRIKYLDELYNTSARGMWDATIANAGTHAHVLVCGHNPAISQLATQLAAGTPALPRHIDLPPAALLSALWHEDSWASLALADASAALLLVV
jgi:phosphohistidine phosphatase